MTKIKICGITNYEDAINAAKLGADYLGFNFYRQSPRCIQKDKAKEIIKKLPKNVKKVGIFVNEKMGRIKSIADFCRLDAVQLSGDENQDFVLNLKKRLNKKIIKSFRIKNKDDIKKTKLYQTDFIMFDSFKKGFFGGTGIELNPKLINGLECENLFLAGGLNAANVGPAIQNIKPFAVDVCSGIESCPGKKDLRKMKEFVEAVKCSP